MAGYQVQPPRITFNVDSLNMSGRREGARRAGDSVKFGLYRAKSEVNMMGRQASMVLQHGGESVAHVTVKGATATAKGAKAAAVSTANISSKIANGVTDTVMHNSEFKVDLTSDLGLDQLPDLTEHKRKARSFNTRLADGLASVGLNRDPSRP